MPPAVRPLLASERDAVLAMLVESFLNDPLFVWFLPREGQRRQWLSWFHRRVWNETGPHGGAFTTSPDEGAILLYPPGTWPPSFGRGLAAWPMPPGLPTWRLLRPGLWIDARIHELHPPEPHLYVYVLGVHPARHGRGIGGTLLRHAAAIADAAGVPCHLETANPDNLGLYRHFGYEVRRSVTEHGGPTIWAMTRVASAPG